MSSSGDEGMPTLCDGLEDRLNEGFVRVRLEDRTESVGGRGAELGIC